MDNYNNYPQYDNSQAYQVPVSRVSTVMKSVYLNMTLGLLVTAFVALGCNSSEAVKMFFVTHSWMMWVLMLAELGIVFACSGAARRMSGSTALLLFYVFAAINGLMLWPIFMAYTGVSIAKTFFITAGTFGAMSVYGYFTDRDLSRMGSLLFMALIGLIIASVVNIFLHSSGLDWIITIAGVLIFVGLTAWDTQQIKRLAAFLPDASTARIAAIGALTLYLDFINMFLYLLRLFGDNRD